MRLLVETHVAEALVRGLQQHGLDAVALQDWHGGAFRTATDEEILAAAYQERRIIVTFDCRTIPPLLKEWAETGRHHGGVIFINSKSFAPDDIGGLQRALLRVRDLAGDQDWEDQAIFLLPA